MLLASVALDSYSFGTEINHSLETGIWCNTFREGSRIAGGWGGAYVGAQTLGTAGAAVETAIASGIGTAIGGTTGAIIGGVLGYFGGSHLSQAAASRLF